MAGIFPQSAIEHLAPVAGIGLEGLELHIANCFKADANQSNCCTDDGNGRQDIGACQQYAKLGWQADHEEQRNLHPPSPEERRFGKTHALLVHRMAENLLVAWIHAFLAPAQEQMRSQPDAPKRGEHPDRVRQSPGGFGLQKGCASHNRHAIGPECIDEGHIADPDGYQPKNDHDGDQQPEVQAQCYERIQMASPCPCGTASATNSVETISRIAFSGYFGVTL